MSDVMNSMGDFSGIATPNSPASRDPSRLGLTSVDPSKKSDLGHHADSEDEQDELPLDDDDAKRELARREEQNKQAEKDKVCELRSLKKRCE